MVADLSECPICGSKLTTPSSTIGMLDAYRYDCPNCGPYELTGTADHLIVPSLAGAPAKRPIVSHHVRRWSTGSEVPRLDWDQCKNLLERGELPTVHEQSENLIRFIGDSTTDPGKGHTFKASSALATVGALSPESIAFCLSGLAEEDLVKVRSRTLDGESTVVLTFHGWGRYEELRRGKTSGTKAFMAMAFGDGVLNSLLNDHFRSAVAQTGFHLTRLDDAPKAGNIDNRMLAEIRSSRFLIADLTHDNSGAYWEAGFAEGLGKPVIYTCSNEVFSDKGTHFDTNHHQTVLWDAASPEAACDLLKATIRNTFPDAKQED